MVLEYRSACNLGFAGINQDSRFREEGISISLQNFSILILLFFSILRLGFKADYRTVLQ